METTTDRSGAGGFTLIELLTIIAVLGILTAILLPVFLAVRERARATACADNLHQLQIAVMQYAGDHDSLLPPDPTYFGGRFVNPTTRTELPMVDRARQLTAALRPYIKDAAVWFCPSDRFAQIDSPEGFVNHRYTSYKTGLSWYATGEAPGLGRTFLDMPAMFPRHGAAETLLLTDDLWGCARNASDADATPYSHRGRFNAVMFDGHLVNFGRGPGSCDSGTFNGGS